jgi:hypothetical protein
LVYELRFRSFLDLGEELRERGIAASPELAAKMIGIGPWAFPGAGDLNDFGSAAFQEPPDLAPEPTLEGAHGHQP